MLHFLDLSDFNGDEVRQLLKIAVSLKADQQSGGTPLMLKGKNLAMIFEKNSTRTRVSFEIGMRQLGGYVMELNCKDSQMGRGETVADTARVMSRYVDVMVMRALEWDTLKELAKHASIPVVNGMTGYNHPCQALADVMTFEEKRGSIVGKKIAWMGEVTNVCNSLIHMAMLLGFHLHIAAPEHMQPTEAMWDWVKAQKEAGSKGTISFDVEAEKAATDADAVATDIWYDKPEEKTQKIVGLFTPYQVNEVLMAHAKEDALFMHCLPARRGEEVTADIIDGKQSIVFDEAENRLHAQKAVLLYALGVERV